MTKLSLPTVTLCAAASVNVRATVAALTRCLDQVEFARCLLFTDQVELVDDERILPIPIARLSSASAYSKLLLNDLVLHVETDHCLVVQWDGFVVDPSGWSDEFLSFDYIGAPWPQFHDGHDVGNGGFSLRSKKLLRACKESRFVASHPEDVAICRANRPFLEANHGIRFAGSDVAARFAFERTLPSGRTFGFHGIFNMVPLLGIDRFWEIYTSLDDPSTAAVDYAKLMRQLMVGRNGLRRGIRLTTDVLRTLLRRLR